MDLLPQQPEIQRLVVDGRDRDARVSLLLVETVKLLEEIDLRTGGSFDRVETLQTSLESERLCGNDGILKGVQFESVVRHTSVSVTNGIAQPVGGMILHMP